MGVDPNPQSSITLSLGFIDLSEVNAVSDGSIQGPHLVIPNLNRQIGDNLQEDALIDDAELNLQLQVGLVHVFPKVNIPLALVESRLPPTQVNFCEQTFWHQHSSPKKNTSG